MLAHCPVLIVEDDPYVALDLSSTIEELDGRVVGPTHDVDEALELLRSERVGAAIIDWQLAGCDASPIAWWLFERQIAFVIHATGALPLPDRARHPDVPMLVKPQRPRTILTHLLKEMQRIEDRSSGGAKELQPNRN